MIDFSVPLRISLWFGTGTVIIEPEEFLSRCIRCKKTWEKGDFHPSHGMCRLMNAIAALLPRFI